MRLSLLRGAIAAALTIAALAPASGQQLWKWSTTSATNSNADPAINWATGMAPSAVSPSARAMMAATARYRGDVGGRLTTTGTSTAYALTTNSSLASTPENGQLLCFTPNVTNAASVTLAADSGTAFPIRTDASTAVPASTLIAGSPYCAVFNSSASAWILHGFFGNPYNVPLGAVLDYAGSTAPNSNFALAYGQAISRTTYSALFSLVGTTYGSGDGTTTFNLPDLRGRVVAGVDNMGGSTAGRITVAGGNFDGTVLGGSGGAQNHTLTSAQMPAHTHTGTTDSGGSHNHTGTTDSGGSHTHTGTTSTTGAHTHAPGGGGFFLTTGTGATGLGAGSNQTASTATDSQGDHNHTFTTDAGGTHTHTFTTSTASAHTHTFTSGSTGGGGSHPIVQPTMTLSKIIRIFFLLKRDVMPGAANDNTPMWVNKAA